MEINFTFQSTRPHGARHKTYRHCIEIFAVSIHAPAWGATRCARVVQTTPAGFNPRARMGRDLSQPAQMSLRASSFNPRARMGRDITEQQVVLTAHVSIHAPAWGATSGPFAAPRLTTVSIHAPAWGATPIVCSEAVGKLVSIHAPAWGATASKINACIIGPFMNLCAKVIKIIGFIVLFKEIFLYLFEVK